MDESKLALTGMSMGGYLGARAVAFEHRFKAAILFDGVYSLSETFRHTLPQPAIATYDAGNEEQGDQIVYKAMEHSTGLRWAVTQGLWSFKAATIVEMLEKARAYTMDGVIEQIQCPCLVMEA